MSLHEASPDKTAVHDFSGKHVLVTGGTKGIGRACVRLFAACGATVTATYASDEPAADALRRELDTARAGHEVLRCDTGDHDAVRRILARMDDDGRLPDVLVCNAAYQRKASLRETDLPLLEQTFRVNVFGNYLLIREVADRLEACGRGGAIIVNGSNQSAFVFPTGFAYSLSKAALDHLVRHCAYAYAKAGIRVNGIVLGWFDTEGERQFYSGEQIARQAAEGIPLGRAGNPAEAAQLIAYVAGEHGAYITGSLLRIDGGFSLAPDTST
jgi:NAD(P)-dependent dehydrogenase (short-subunit alcohol dehydrogenase family)